MEDFWKLLESWGIKKLIRNSWYSRHEVDEWWEPELTEEQMDALDGFYFSEKYDCFDGKIIFDAEKRTIVIDGESGTWEKQHYDLSKPPTIEALTQEINRLQNKIEEIAEIWSDCEKLKQINIKSILEEKLTLLN